MRFVYNPEALQNHPCVYKVDRYLLTLTYPFRKEMFKEWKKQQTVLAIVRMLDDNGLTSDLVGKDYPLDVMRSFKNSGFPRPHRSETAVMTEYKEENPLILSEKYIPSGAGHGMKLANEFMLEITSRYPEITVEESMRMAGLDPIDVGYQRIQRVKNELKKEEQRLYRKQMGQLMQDACIKENDLFGTRETNENERFRANIVPESVLAADVPAESNPYVRTASYTGILMHESFYNEAYHLYSIGIDELFRIYEIDPDTVSEKSKAAIGSKLYHWQRTEAQISSDSVQYLRIQRARLRIMNRLLYQKEGAGTDWDIQEQILCTAE